MSNRTAKPVSIRRISTSTFMALRGGISPPRAGAGRQWLAKTASRKIETPAVPAESVPRRFALFVGKLPHFGHSQIRNRPDKQGLGTNYFDCAAVGSDFAWGTIFH